MDTIACGAKGIATFSESIKYGYLPQESSIEYEGLYFDYYFETKDEQEHLFRQNFCYGVSKDPLSGQLEQYVSVGLASKLDGEGLYKHGGRPPLNLVIVLDVSGSMGEGFSGNEESKSKLEVAKEALLTLIGRLSKEDRFGLVLFDTEAEIVQKLQSIGTIDLGKLKTSILSFHTRGGTSLTAGITASSRLFDGIIGDSKYENRLIFLTDMIPNTDDTDGKSLFDMTQKNANKKIYTTFIGVGVDFNTELTSLIGTIRACNYFGVQTTKQFKKQMDQEFDYMVTPNVFNCNVDFETKGWEVERVYGSPGYEYPKKGRLVHMDSTFPSLKEGSNMTKGGVILVKLKKKNSDTSSMKFHTSYEDRSGNKHSLNDVFTFPNVNDTTYENISIRKAILLTRYVNFMKHFLRDAKKESSKEATINKTTGISVPALLPKHNTTQSMVAKKPLNSQWKSLFKQFIDHFEGEMKAIEDPTLDRELQQLLSLYQVEEKPSD